MTSLRRRHGWREAGAALVVVVAGVGAYFLQSPHVVRDTTPPAAADAGPVRDAVPAPPVRGMPTRVVIPALGMDAGVVPIKAVGRVLIPPSDPQQLGWWADGALPGAARGSALVTGHTVHTGGGAFDRLEELEPGDRIRVTTSRGAIDYTVRGVEVLPRGITARRAERLFGQDGPPRLVLITCADWNGTRYLSNALVTATRTTA